MNGMLAEAGYELLEEFFSDSSDMADTVAKTERRISRQIADYERAAAKTAAVEAERRKAQDALEKLPNFGRF